VRVADVSPDGRAFSTKFAAFCHNRSLGAGKTLIDWYIGRGERRLETLNYNMRLLQSRIIDNLSACRRLGLPPLVDTTG